MADTSTQPDLSILIPALRCRATLHEALAAELERQVGDLARGRDAVEILWDLDSGQATSGQKRNRLLARARGRYLAFVDDDDWISPGYVGGLVGVTCSHAGVDVITFRALRTFRDPRGIPCYQRLAFGLGYADHACDGARVLFAANHLCAWRAAIARAVPFPANLGYGDDQLWYKALHAAGLATTELHIPNELYEYRFSREDTRNQTSERVRYAHARARGGVEWFLMPNGVYLATCPACKTRGEGLVVCTGPLGILVRLHRAEARRSGIVEIA